MNNPLSLTDPSGYSWLSNNWRSLVGAAIGIAASIVTVGILAPVGLAGLSALTVSGIATAAGAVGEFAGGFAGTLLNGGDLGQAFKAGVVGGIVGGASGFLAFAAGGISGNSIGAILERMGRHAFANGWLSAMQGQNMFSGMLTGGASSLGGAGLSSLKIENVGLLTVGNAVIGGTVSVIGGGKFANGAVTGAFTMLFNHLLHRREDPPGGSAGEVDVISGADDQIWGKMDIISNVGPDAGLTDGHAWIRVESKNGSAATMSLWGNKGEQELWMNLELNAGYGVVNKSTYITNGQYVKLINFNSNPNNINWTPWNTCAGYSTKLWNNVTGGNLSARDYFRFTTPRSLSKSILNNPKK